MKIEDIKVGSIIVRNGKDGRGLGMARDSTEGGEYTVLRVWGKTLYWKDDKGDQCSDSVSLVAEYFYLKVDTKIDFTKPLQTKDGRQVTLKFSDGRGQWPVRGYVGDADELCAWTATGQYYEGRESPTDLVNVKKRITTDVFINVYENGDGTFSYGQVVSKQTAAALNAGKSVAGRAKVTIDIEEGEFQ